MMSPPLSLAWDPAVFADAARGTHRAIMNDRQRDPRYKAEGGQANTDKPWESPFEDSTHYHFVGARLDAMLVRRL